MPSTKVTLSQPETAGSSSTYTDRLRRDARAKSDAAQRAARSAAQASARRITFSVVGNGGTAGSAALSSGQQQDLRNTLDTVSRNLDVTFTEVSTGGDLQIDAGSDGTSSPAAAAQTASAPASTGASAPPPATAGGSSDWAYGSYELEALLRQMMQAQVQAQMQSPPTPAPAPAATAAAGEHHDDDRVSASPAA